MALKLSDGSTKDFIVNYVADTATEGVKTAVGKIDGFDTPTRDIISGGLSKENGAKAFCYWNSTNLVTCCGFEGSATFELSGVSGEVRFIDPMDGAIYEIGEKIMQDKGNGLFKFTNIPVKDYPLIITFGEF